MGGIGRPAMKRGDGRWPTAPMLVEAIRRQYQEAGPAMCRPALDTLAAPDARTVTTGHQLCLATGPAFTCYKALTTCTWREQLEARWGTPVIPVFWMASEDHDFEEVCSLWDGADGTVGRVRRREVPWAGCTADNAADMLRAWARAAGLDKATVDRVVSASSGTLSQAMRRWIHDVVRAGPSRGRRR